MPPAQARSRLADALIATIGSEWSRAPRDPRGGAETQACTHPLHLIGAAYATCVASLSKRGRCDSVGVYYTPRAAAERLAVLAAKELRTPAPSALAVLDPACGAGSLLLAWMTCQPTDRLIGWDIDGDALRLAEAILTHQITRCGADTQLSLKKTDLFDTPIPERTAPHVVLVNPPYGTQLTAPAAAYALSARYPGREADLFALSLERVLAVAPDAVVAMVLPDVIRMQPEYTSLRGAVMATRRLAHLEQLDFGVFRGASVQPNLAVFAPSDDPRRTFSLHSRTGEHFAATVEAVTRDPIHAWRMSAPWMTDLWHLCVGRGTALGELARCHEGVHTGNIRHKLFTEDPTAAAVRPMLKGADIGRFSHRFRGRYCRYDRTLIDRHAGDYASLRDPEIFQSPKLLSRQTSDHLVVCRDDEGYVTDNTLHTIRLRDDAGISLDWLLLYLNSSLATALYRFCSGECARPLPQIKLRLLRSLPVPLCSIDRHTLDEVLGEAGRQAARGGLSAALKSKLDAIVFESVGIQPSEWGRIGQAASLQR